MADEGFNLPTDSLVEILLRLPTSARRRFRLVCKRWRDAIDERTPERQVRTKILDFISDRAGSRAAVVFDERDGRLRHEWTYEPTTRGGGVDMVGTCNGLICLHETCEGYRSVITVANPITGETLALPPLPAAWDTFSHLGLYGFGYHPTTGRYKVVRVPSFMAWRRDTVHVLTLGGGDPAAAAAAGWREVTAAPAAAGHGHNSLCGMVCVDGWAYWFGRRADRVVALDLDDGERVACFAGPPGVRAVERTGDAPWKVTNVHGRLGVAVPRYEGTTTVEVWVLDGGGGGGAGGEPPPRWSRRYILTESGEMQMWNVIVFAPQLAHGEYVLSMCWDRKRLYRRKVGGGTDVDGDDGRTTRLRPSEGAELIMRSEVCLGTFAYAETREPLPRVRG